jgi:hypothetical protein
MYFSSKFPAGRVLTVALALTLCGFGIPVLQAQAAQQDCQAQSTPPCPIDPHAQHEAEEAQQRAAAKQQKEAEHAQHEAAEACERHQKALQHAQHEAEEAQERAAAKEANVKDLESKMCTSTAEEKSQSQPDTMLSKPTPAPEVAPPAPVPEAVPPMPEPEQTPPPKQLPKTASQLDLIGLIGLVCMSGGYLTRFFRR